MDRIYNISIHKLHNCHRESDGLRRMVLLNNFVYEKFISPPKQDEVLEWDEEDIKKDEESWLDSCLDQLDDEEDEDGFIRVNKPLESQNQSVVASPFLIERYDDPRDYEDHYVKDNNNHDTTEQQQPPSKSDNDVVIPQDLLHLPFFDLEHMDNTKKDDYDNDNHNDNDDNDDLMNTSITSSQEDDDVNMSDSSENLTCEKGFHPYWKDNSIILNLLSSSPFRSFSIPKFFHKYCLKQQDNDASPSPRRIVPSFDDNNELLQPTQPDYLYQSLEFPSYESPLRRSKDDLDILCSLTPRNLDRGALIDIITMLEYYGGKANKKKSNTNSSEIDNSNIWFIDNNNS